MALSREINCPYCHQPHTIRERTLRQIQKIGKKRLKCSKCNRYFYAVLKQPKT
ncbi:MAG: hypothetical protein QXG39_07495 [Candidatus Aenigmatarchaeota archaeon]